VIHSHQQRPLSSLSQPPSSFRLHWLPLITNTTMVSQAFTIFFSILFASLAASQGTSSDDVSTLCISGCCGLKLSLNASVLNLQSQIDSLPSPIAISVPLSTPHLHCCPCPAAANNTVDTAIPATVVNHSVDTKPTVAAPLPRKSLQGETQCPEWLCHKLCGNKGCDTSCCNEGRLAKHVVNLNPAQMLAWANSTSPASYIE
jgi:hypothetical protein